MARNIYGFYGTLNTGGTGELVSESFTSVRYEIQFDDINRSGSKLNEIDLDDGDVVEVELDAITLIMSVAELYQYRKTGQLRDENDEPRMLPTALPYEHDTRGIVSFTIRVLRVLGINVAGELVKVAAAKVESWLDDGGPGMYKVGRDGSLSKQAIVTGSDKALLLIHGTGSATARAFDGLLPHPDNDNPLDIVERWSKLFDEFDGNIYALEHKSLTQTPVDNVIDFLSEWPADGGPSLTILSHSRGGNVGDYISCLADWESQPPELLTELPDTSEKNALQKLQNQLRHIAPDKRPRIRRHVRVATPAAGTSLASKKTHIMLSVLANLTGRVPFAGVAFSAIGDLAAAIVKEGLDEGTLPGIDAQKNRSLFVKAAQHYSAPETELFVLSGVSNGLLAKTMRAIFSGRHDLVVNTHSMLRGPEYKKRMVMEIDDDVITHTTYFGHRRVQLHLTTVLSGQTSLVFEETARPTGKRGRVKPAEPEEATTLPCLIVLPGIMGSELSIGKGNDECDIWLDYLQLFLGRGKKLQISNEDVKATGVLETGYEDFVNHVRAGRQVHVLPFGYDWRQSVFGSVDELDALIKNRLTAAPDKPITLVCHSMGGLVARAWRLNHPDTWAKLKAGNGRMVQFGTPNYGSWTIPNIFLGQEKTLNKLALLDSKHETSHWLSWIAQFPGLLELSDFNNESADLRKPIVWKSQFNTSIDTSILREAVKQRDALASDGFEQDEGIVYVAGQSASTPTLKENDGDVSIEHLPDIGDGRVLWPVDENQKSVDYFMSAIHGDMLNKPEYFDAIVELALKGKTGGMQTRPAVSRSATHTEIAVLSMSPDDFESEQLLPTREELQAAVLGGSVRSDTVRAGADEILTLSVTHGNLIFSQAPVMVGHYLGDDIQHAEKSLDTVLGGTLSDRWALGAEFYAGKIGTHEIALQQGENHHGPAGAIVVGLGPMGELQKGDLLITVRNSVLRYAQVCEERGDDCSALKIASLLIGSGQEALEKAEVIDSIVGGVVLANKILSSTRSAQAMPVRISAIEFIEWYLDIAINARHIIQELVDSEQYPAFVKSDIGNNSGGHQRAFADDRDNWWESLRVKMTLPDNAKQPPEYLTRLTYSVLGGNALGTGADVEFVKEEIDADLQPLLSSERAPDEKTVSSLFERLVPRDLKHLAAQKRNLILNLDPAAAYLPWEILSDRRSIDGKPIAVGAGMLRRIVPDPMNMPRVNVVHVESRTAKVIGNPQAGPNFQSLAGAAAEARTVAELLSSKQWSVNQDHIYTESVSPPGAAVDIRNDILAGDYRILHFAAHGIHEEDRKDRVGVVIGYNEEQQREELFAPYHVPAMSSTPSLVFINCCHIGKVTNWQAHRLSASLAAEFIKYGVHCVIGAGWAVEDNAAKHFAETIYSHMLNGNSFGTAVSAARLAVHSRYSGTNTWAAFQCYGNPGYVLTKRTGAPSTQAAPRFFHLSELVLALSNAASDLKGEKASKVRKEQILVQASALYKAAKKIRDDESDGSWADRGEVLNQMAIIYCEAAEEERADNFLDKAIKSDRSGVPLKDILLVANYRARRAEAHCQRAEVNKKLKGKALQPYIDRLTDELEILLKYVKLHKDAHTLEIAASGYKLLAMTERTKTKRLDALEKMAQLYNESAEIGKDNSYYPATNALLGYTFLYRANKMESKAFGDHVDRLTGIIDRSLDKNKDRKKSDFWSMMAEIDVSVTRAVKDQLFDDTFAGAVLAEIKQAAEFHSSQGELNSVSKQFRFIKKMTDEKTEEIAAASVEEQLTVLA